MIHALRVDVKPDEDAFIGNARGFQAKPIRVHHWGERRPVIDKRSRGDLP
jgi:hypothetical protein